MQFCRNIISLLFITTLTFWSHGLFAQQNAIDTVSTPETIKHWKTGGSFGLNFSQVRLANWAGGGQSSVSVGSLINLTTDYNRGKAIWENRLDIGYGLIRQGNARQEQSDFRKTDDLLNLVSKYYYHLDEGFYFSGMADYRTQMDVGYEYREQNGETVRDRISDFMAPGFLITSLGMTYKKGKVYTLKFAPFTGKYTFVFDDALSARGAFGVRPGQRARAEIGALFRYTHEQEIFTDTNLRSNFNLFANYETLSHIDVNWEAILMMKVNKYINSTVAAQLIYDHDVIQKVQWRNAINVGLVVNL